MEKPGEGHRLGGNDRALFKALKDNAQLVNGRYVFQLPLVRLARLARLTTDETRRLLGILEGRGALHCVKTEGRLDKYILDDFH